MMKFKEEEIEIEEIDTLSTDSIPQDTLMIIEE